MNRDDKKTKKDAIEIVEEAMHLLRFTPPGVLLSYYAGSLPFILGLLYFLGDMSRNAFAPYHCAGASLLVAALFIWMKCWHSVFLLKLMAMIGSNKAHRWSFRRVMRLFAVQTMFQPSGLFVTIASMILVFPIGWVFAFYQNISIESYEKPIDLKSTLKRSSYLARLWPRQNYLILLIFFLFSIFVFLNVCTAIILIPFLLNRLLGIETVFTLSGIHFFNTTFLAVALGITFLCIDPIVKTVYALRYFYGLSIKSGDDLRVGLKNHFWKYKKAFAILVFMLCAIHSGTAISGEAGERRADVSLSSTENITSERLNHSIEEVMARPEFTWRLPMEKEVKEGEKIPGFFSFMEKWIKKVIRPYPYRKMVHFLNSDTLF